MQSASLDLIDTVVQWIFPMQHGSCVRVAQQSEWYIKDCSCKQISITGCLTGEGPRATMDIKVHGLCPRRSISGSTTAVHPLAMSGMAVSKEGKDLIIYLEFRLYHRSSLSTSVF